MQIYYLLQKLWLMPAARLLLSASQELPEVTIKSDASYVTTTDTVVEERLREMIIARYPDHGIFGEEFENINTDAEFVWVLDPIDGTAAFVAGIPVYGTLIALAWKGKPFIGVIDHPLTDDRWTGVSHTCAFHNGKPVKTRACEALASAYGHLQQFRLYVAGPTGEIHNGAQTGGLRSIWGVMFRIRCTGLWPQRFCH